MAIREIAIIAPLALMAAVGAASRMQRDPFEFTAYSARQEAQLTAYRPLVAEASEAFGSGSVAEARQVASDWVSKAEAGQLAVVPQVSFDDTSDDGVKHEIEDAANQLSVTLTSGALEEIHRNDPALAVSDALLAARIATKVQYFDLSSAANVAPLEVRALHAVQLAEGKLPKAECARIDRQTMAFRIQYPALNAVAIRARQTLINHLLQPGYSIADVKELQKRVPMGDLQGYETAKDWDKRFQVLVKTPADDFTFPLVAQLWRAYRSSNTIDIAVAQAQTTTRIV